ncbi:MAG: type VI secretion system lipoprotein TssJ [Planctomycetes bacterium]|nr:type VI secretion system lipoprotein TssJ [Planctomycetota bacterium]
MKATAMSVVVGAAAFLLAGCGGPKALLVRGMDPLNVNERGESTPVQVRIYFLKGQQRFVSAPYEDLWVKDKEVLGDDYLADPIVITVHHKQDKPESVPLPELKPEVGYVGIMALYRKKDEDGKPRVVVPKDKVDDFVFEFIGYRIELKN